MKDFNAEGGLRRDPDYDREPGCDCPRSELEIGGHGHYVDCERDRGPLDCNGKPLTYVPRPQLGRCWFDKTPHHKNAACFRWYVLRADEQCRGGTP